MSMIHEYKAPRLPGFRCQECGVRNSDHARLMTRCADENYTDDERALRIYRIIRFRQNGRPRTVRNGLTLQEAQLHCGNPETHGEGWFDGYDYIKGVSKRAA